MLELADNTSIASLVSPRIIILISPKNYSYKVDVKWYDDYYQLFLIRIMDRLLGIFEDCICAVLEGRKNDLTNYYENDTLPPRIKTIIRSIESLASHKEGEQDPLLLATLSKFKDDLSIGATQGFQQIFLNKQLPQVFRQTMRQIFILFDNKNTQLNSMFDDVFFYKDIIQAILKDKNISEKEIAQKENISKDKRENVMKLLKKIEEMKRGGNYEENVVKQAQIEIMDLKIEMLEAQHDEEIVKIKELSKNVEVYKTELAAAKDQLAKFKAETDRLVSLQKSDENEIVKLRQEINQLRRESEMFQSSLARKELNSGQLISEKQHLQKELNKKNSQIKQLKQSLKDQKSNQSRLKDEVQSESKTKFKQLESQLNKTKSKHKDAELRLKESQDHIKKYETIIRDKQKVICDLQHQNQKCRLESSTKLEADYQLVKKARVLIESAQSFNRIFNSSHNNFDFANQSSIFAKSDILNNSLSASWKQEKIGLQNYLRKVMGQSVSSKLLNQFPKMANEGSILYRYPQDRFISFEERLNGKKNLLLVCYAQNGAIFGAFSSVGFIYPLKKENNRIIFLFCERKEMMLKLKVKEDKLGITQDDDFLIFGNEQLSLQQNCAYATSYFEPNNNSSLHFTGNIDERVEFLQIVGSQQPNNRILLKRYEILEITTK